MRAAMGAIANLIFLPSLALTLIAGLLAMAVNRGYHNAGWAWVKLFSGLLVFEWGLASIQAPMQQVQVDAVIKGRRIRLCAGVATRQEQRCKVDQQRNTDG